MTRILATGFGVAIITAGITNACGLSPLNTTLIACGAGITSIAATPKDKP